MGDNLEADLKKLYRFQNSHFPILTVYLGYAGKKTPTSLMLISQLHSLVHQNLSVDEKKLFRKDLEKIESYLRQDYDARGDRSVVFFSGGEKIWQELSFEFYLPQLCIVSYSPYIKPIEDAAGSYKKYLVLLADREKGILFTVHLGELEDKQIVLNGKVPQKVKAKKIDYGRDDKILRHIEDHLHRHLIIIVDKARDMVRKDSISFIVLGGHRELFGKLKKHLPYPLNKMVVAEFITELNIPINELLAKSKKVVSVLN